MRNLIIAVLCFVSAASWAQKVTNKVTFTKRVAFNDSILIPASAGIGKVLTSDSHGYATWQPASGGGASKAFNGLHTNVDTVLAGGEIIRPTQMLRTVGSKYSGLKFGDNLNGFLSNSTFLTQYDSLTDYYNVAGVADMTAVGGSQFTSIFGLVSLAHDTQTLLMSGPDSYNLSIKHNGSAQYTFDATHKSVSSTIRNGSNYYGFGADSSSAYWKVGTTTIKLPSNAGTNGQVLTTDGSNQASWTTIGGGGGSPSGGFMAVQMDNGDGTFYGNNQRLYWDTFYVSLFVGSNSYQINPYYNSGMAVYAEYLNTEQLNISNDLESSGGGWVGLKANPATGVLDSYDLVLPGNLPASTASLGSDNMGNLSWQLQTDFTFASLDSISIYTGTAANGKTLYCSDCTGDGITGRIVTYIAGAWRRLKFD